MKKRQRVLLGTMLRSTSIINKYKYSNDKKARSKVIGVIVGRVVLMAVLILYSFLMNMGVAQMGMSNMIPMTTAIVIATLSFVFTLLKTNGYLFGFKEYDMLVSMPFETKEIVADKFLYMYIKNLPWMMAVSLSMLVGYVIFEGAGVGSILAWLILSFILPMIPTVLASAIGALFMAIGSKFKFKKLVQTILLFGFIILCFCFRFIVEGIIRDNAGAQVVNMAADSMNTVGKFYFPARMFEKAILEGSILNLLLLAGLSFLVYEAFFIVVSKGYSRINSKFASHDAKGNYKMTKQKKRSIVNAIAFKEFRTFLGSTNYLINAGMGQVLITILSLVVLILGADKIIYTITNGAPVSKEMLLPGIPYIIFFLTGMVASTVCSPSLEGKNYWIVQSLPIDKMILYKGKMLFNMYITVPFMALGTIVLGFAFGGTVIDVLVYLVCGFVLCARSTAWGMVCGIKFIKLDWENDIEVIKQGMGVLVYLFPNMFVTMILVVALIFASSKVNGTILILGITLVEAILTFLSYQAVKKMAKN